MEPEVFQVNHLKDYEIFYEYNYWDFIFILVTFLDEILFLVSQTP